MFNERLKELRKLNKMTQKQVADKIKMSERNYQELEYGNVKPSFDSLINLSNLFNVSLDFIVGRSNDPKIYK